MPVKNGDRVRFSLPGNEGFPAISFQGTLAFILEYPDGRRSACVIVDVAHSHGCRPNTFLVAPEALESET